MRYPCHEPCRDNDGCACRAAEAARQAAYMVDRDPGDEVPTMAHRPSGPMRDFWRRVAIHEDTLRRRERGRLM